MKKQKLLELSKKLENVEKENQRCSLVKDTQENRVKVKQPCVEKIACFH